GNYINYNSALVIINALATCDNLLTLQIDIQRLNQHGEAVLQKLMNKLLKIKKLIVKIINL
ncbi:hypothetical protein ABPG73_008575, partial [Tetrahymena malaccensis]